MNINQYLQISINIYKYLFISIISFLILSIAGIAYAGVTKDLADSQNYDILYTNSERISGCGYNGWAVVMCDINADGIKDIVTAGSGVDLYDTYDTGAVYIQFGGSGISTGDKDLQTASNWDICYYGTGSDYMGYSLAVGDVNNDGKDDLLISAYYDDYGGTDRGTVYVVFGSTGITTGAQLLQTIGFDIRYQGPVNSQILGQSVLADDINGDGIDDVIIGSQYQDFSASNAGSVYVIFGGSGIATGAIDLSNASNYNIRYDGVAATDYLGNTSGLAVGDVNGDTKGDLIIGSYLADSNGADSGTVYVVFGGSSIPTGNIALSNANNYNIRYIGSGASDYLGLGVACGDINNDGIADIIMGAYGDDNGASATGSVYVKFGSASIPTGDRALATGSNYDIRYDGASGSDYLGYYGVTCGDINGDSIKDIIMSAPYDDNNGGSSGAVFVKFGGSGIPTGNISLATGSNYDIRYDGHDATDYLGIAVCAGGDVNGDTKGDLIMGAYYANRNNRTYSGSAYVKFGGSGIPTGNISLATGANYDIRYDGEAIGHHLGYKTLSGDLNNDGLPDLIISSYWDASNDVYEGTVYVIFGSDNMGSGTIDLNTPANYNIKYHGTASDYLREIAVGDVNGDGIDDLIMGATYDDYGGTDRGSVYVKFGDASITTGDIDLSVGGTYNIRYDGAYNSGYLGQSLAVGDVNGDGYNDIAMSAPYGDYNSRTDSGAVYVVFGGPAIATGNRDFTTISNFNIRYDGKAVSDYLGYGGGSLVIGDINGDGIGDLFMGCMYADLTLTNCGAVYGIYGSRSISTGIKDLTSSSNYDVCFEGPLASNYLGYGGLAIGDVNADGYTDLFFPMSYADNNGRSDSGSIFVLFGSNAKRTGAINMGTSTNYDIRYDGAAGSDYLGHYQWNSSGDVNGDGIDDVILQVYYDDYSGRTDCGGIYVIYGSPNIKKGNIDLSSAGNYDLYYPGPDSYAYAVLPSVRYLRRNSVCDLLIGARSADIGGVPKAGAVYYMKNPAKFWDGGGTDNNWSTQDNWSGNTLPQAGDRVVFDVRSTKNCTIDSSVSVKSVAIMSGYTGTISCNAGVSCSETFVQHSGTVNSNGFTLSAPAGTVLFGGTINTTDPAVHWRFDEAVTGSADAQALYDESINNNDAVGDDGANNTGLTWASGKFGGAVNFDGIDDFVHAEGVSSINTTQGGYNTVTFWMKWNGTVNVVPFAFQNTSLYNLWIYTNTAIGFNVGSGDCYGFDPTGLNLANRWAYVAVLFYNGAYTGNNKIYIDGVEQVLSQRVGSAQSGTAQTTIKIGRVTSGYYYGGLIDDVCIYNYALTPSQVIENYNAGCSAYLGSGAKGNDPVAHWRFDEAVSGSADGQTLYDETANNKDAAGNDGANNTGLSWTSGRYGGAIDFDGVDDYVSVNDDAVFDFDGAFTISAWAKPDNISYSGRLVYRYDSTSGDGYYLTQFTSGGGCWNFTIFVNGSGNYTVIQSDSQPTGDWQYITGVRELDGSMKLYIDGVLQSQTGTRAGAIDSSGNLYIAQDYSGGGRFPGVIDDVKIYNYARNAAEILNDYNGSSSAYLGSGTKSAEPAGHWRFDEGASQTAYDESTNNNDGTIYPLTGGTNTTLTDMWQSSGKYGACLEFDGTDDYVDCGNGASLNITVAITVEAWIKRFGDNPAGQSFEMIAAKRGTNAGYCLAIYNTAVDSLMFWINGVPGSGGDGFYMDIPVSNNVWHHLVGVYDGTNINVYLDGALKNTKTTAQASIVTDATLVQIGRGQSGWYYFNGIIDDVRVYNYARTQDEILVDYNNGMAVRIGD